MFSNEKFRNENKMSYIYLMQSWIVIFKLYPHILAEIGPWEKQHIFIQKLVSYLLYVGLINFKREQSEKLTL